MNSRRPSCYTLMYFFGALLLACMVALYRMARDPAGMPPFEPVPYLLLVIIAPVPIACGWRIFIQRRISGKMPGRHLAIWCGILVWGAAVYVALYALLVAAPAFEAAGSLAGLERASYCMFLAATALLILAFAVVYIVLVIDIADPWLWLYEDRYRKMVDELREANRAQGSCGAGSSRAQFHLPRRSAAKWSKEKRG